MMAKTRDETIWNSLQPYLQPGEQLRHWAYGVKQPNVALVIAVGVLPAYFLTKHYVVGLTQSRLIVMRIAPPIGKRFSVKGVVEYRLEELRGLVVEIKTGPIFTRIRIKDVARPFAAKFHRLYSKTNRYHAMGIAQVIGRRVESRPVHVYAAHFAQHSSALPPPLPHTGISIAAPPGPSWLQDPTASAGPRPTLAPPAIPLALTQVMKEEPPPSAATARLKIVDGPGSGHEFELPHAPVTIGRDPYENGVGLDFGDQHMHRVGHATIGMEGSDYTLSDTGKTNPVKINSELVVGCRTLKSGDLIGIGRTILRLEITRASSADVPERA